MPIQIIIGAQWGDEGKGRIVDWFAAGASIVARFNGGDNAGHTVNVGGKTFKLHLIPSGAIHPGCTSVLGKGMVVNPPNLLKEMDALAEAGIDLPPERLRLDYAAHLITPAHRALDAAQESARGRDNLGTTGRGIGPAYTDKTARQGLRAADMLDPQAFAGKIAAHIEQANHLLQSLYGAPPLDADTAGREYAEYARRLTPYIEDTSIRLNQALADGQFVLAEGAQGTLLDLDHGTYPFVTSSTATAPGALSGLGLGIRPVERVTGVTKVFQTRVGSGPFPTELSGSAAERLRGTGANPWDEFGTTTGRPRRVGWLDCVLLRYAVRINGFTELVLTKLDVLAGLEQVRLCTAYRQGPAELCDLPLGPADLAPFEPVYEDLPGWPESATPPRSYNNLPAEAQAYVRRIAELAGVPVSLVSIGPERSQMLEVPG